MRPQSCHGALVRTAVHTVLYLKHCCIQALHRLRCSVGVPLHPSLHPHPHRSRHPLGTYSYVLALPGWQANNAELSLTLLFIALLVWWVGDRSRVGFCISFAQVRIGRTRTKRLYPIFLRFLLRPFTFSFFFSCIDSCQRNPFLGIDLFPWSLFFLPSSQVWM